MRSLPPEATWSVWLEQLSELARLSLRDPAPVQAVLAELAPMGDVGPVGLEEVRQQDVEARGMAPEEGLEALDRILYASPTPQVIVSPVDLHTLFAHAFALAAGGGNLDERLASLRLIRHVTSARITTGNSRPLAL